MTRHLSVLGFTFRRAIACSSILWSGALLSQPSVTLSTRAITALTDSLCSQLVRYYVEKEPAVRMGAYIRKRTREGVYYRLAAEPHALAAALTRDAQSVHRDEHFHVEYHPELALEISGHVEDVPGMVAEKLKQDRNRNFGFKKAEILNGNIGYLEISSFSRLNEYSRATADAALRLVSNANALIIDLRYGLGGSPEMVTHLLGKFFKERTHVTDIYIRSENATLPYFTRPDSTMARLQTIPVYILTSYKTFSAAEGFIYAMKSFRRATIIGETTRGGAHTVTYRPLSSGFVADIPFGKALHPVSHANWEGTGITPDQPVAAELALETAEARIFDYYFKSAHDSSEIKRLTWQHRLLKAANHPYTADTLQLKKLAGNFGGYVVSYEKGCLFYQKAGKAKFPLVPISPNCLRPKGNDTFLVEFVSDPAAGPLRMITTHDDGRTEVAILSQ